MKNKSDVFAYFKDFHKSIQTQYGIVVKVLRFNNVIEIPTRHLDSIYLQRGYIIKLFTHIHRHRIR